MINFILQACILTSHSNQGDLVTRLEDSNHYLASFVARIAYERPELYYQGDYPGNLVNRIKDDAKNFLKNVASATPRVSLVRNSETKMDMVRLRYDVEGIDIVYQDCGDFADVWIKGSGEALLGSIENAEAEQLVKTRFNIPADALAAFGIVSKRNNQMKTLTGVCGFGDQRPIEGQVYSTDMQRWYSSLAFALSETEAYFQLVHTHRINTTEAGGPARVKAWKRFENGS